MSTGADSPRKARGLQRLFNDLAYVGEILEVPDAMKLTDKQMTQYISSSASRFVLLHSGVDSSAHVPSRPVRLVLPTPQSEPDNFKLFTGEQVEHILGVSLNDLKTVNDTVTDRHIGVSLLGITTEKTNCPFPPHTPIIGICSCFLYSEHPDDVILLPRIPFSHIAPVWLSTFIGMAFLFTRHIMINCFCSSCGKRMIVPPEGRALRCEVCKRDVWPRTDPAVIGCVASPDEEHVLLAQRVVGTPMPGHVGKPWGALSGYLEAVEIPKCAFVREVQEEVGLKVEVTESLASYGALQPWPTSGSLMVGVIGRALDEPYNEIDPISLLPKITVDPMELSDAKWFTREYVKKALFADVLGTTQSDETLHIVGRHTIARRIIEWWCFSRDQEGLEEYLRIISTGATENEQTISSEMETVNRTMLPGEY